VSAAESVTTEPDLSPWLGRVTCGDCLELLLELPTNSVDSIITDPPYGITGQGQTRVRTVVGAGRHKSGHCVKETVVADWGDEDREVGYGWVPEAHRVLRPGGNIVVFCSDVQFSTLKDALSGSDFSVRQFWTWTKTNAVPTPRKNFCSAVELGWWATKPGAKHVWNGGAKTPNWFTGPFDTRTFASGYRTHPMQKPDWLLRRMVELWTDPGEVVLDPFAGSGSTIISAEALGRKALGFDIDPDHAAKSNARIAHAQAEAGNRLPL
jgi:site-specific DNA-methyltransferase (adenine-specific)